MILDKLCCEYAVQAAKPSDVSVKHIEVGDRVQQFEYQANKNAPYGFGGNRTKGRRHGAEWPRMEGRCVTISWDNTVHSIYTLKTWTACGYVVMNDGVVRSLP